ncbi:MAG TPA: 16S rRNA (guanine(966)-N(2))-methyltransferase RsmD [Polyangia bacterium]|jgi:16S rRNA (guanine966-N2)-methyltransferase|nr:16S rRNA (guanine(966)-N(2))-methyltransferase RsmD [Polyangia bacterium]
MRLTGGLDRGRRLFVPRGSRTRPTAAKVREAIFNILGPPPGPVLDLYAGSGALGLEALSRGAPAAVFVERDGAALGALRRNLRESGAESRGTIIGADVRSALRKLSSGKQQFSWVFLDPPYIKETEGVLAELSGSDLLTACAVVIVEHDRRHPSPASVGCLFLTDRRQYGDTELSFYRCSGS